MKMLFFVYKACHKTLQRLLILVLFAANAHSLEPSSHTEECACHPTERAPGDVLESEVSNTYWPKHLRILSDAPFFGKKASGIYASGSAQPNMAQLIHLQAMIYTRTKNVHTPIYIVDTRLEPHGFFGQLLKNDQPVQVHGAHFWECYEGQRAYTTEREIFDRLNKTRRILVHTRIKKAKDKRLSACHRFFEPNVTARFYTEYDACRYLGMGYVRLGIADHHAPSAGVVVKWLEFLKSLPKSAWVHIHCSAGRGRTSTLLALLDLFKRQPTESFEDFAKYHKVFGSIDFLKIKPSYKSHWAVQRQHMIKAFFDMRKRGESFENAVQKILPLLKSYTLQALPHCAPHTLSAT